jgi:hypothetical protein
MAIDPADIQPALEGVGARIKGYTRDLDGNLLGTFTAETAPTAEEAQAEVLRAARYVAQEVGSPSVEWTEKLIESSRDAVAARAALLIASGSYGDGSATDETRVDQLGRIAREELKALKVASRDNRSGGRRFHSIRQCNRIVGS